LRQPVLFWVCATTKPNESYCQKTITSPLVRSSLSITIAELQVRRGGSQDPACGRALAALGDFLTQAALPGLTAQPETIRSLCRCDLGRWATAIGMELPGSMDCKPLQPGSGLLTAVTAETSKDIPGLDLTLLGACGAKRGVRSIVKSTFELVRMLA